MILRKGLKISLITLLLFLLLVSLVNADEQPLFELNARSALLMEYETGDILFEKNPYQELPPASMTKIMTMLLVLEDIEAGRATLDDKIVVSELAASMGGSQIWLEPGEEMTLEEMMKAIAIVSANDACVAVAEYLAGSEEAFVTRMNDRAAELGLKNTYFYNTNGLPASDPAEKGNYTCAHDLAVMAREILKYPKVLEWTSTWIDYLRDGESVLNNTNRMVRHYKGADGLKTGYTEEAKYCVTSTAKRDGIRFIAVIMGDDNSKTRFDEAGKLLSFGFGAYRGLNVVDEGQVLQDVLINNGKEELAKGLAAEQLIIPVKKGEEEQIKKEIIFNKKIRAPLTKGDQIGEIRIYKGNLLIKKTNIIVDRDVEKASIFQMIYRIIKQLIISILSIFS